MKWCARCDNCRWVCENHPDRPWLGDHACSCGGGMPCPACNRSDAETLPDLPEGFEAVLMTGSRMRRIPGEEIESSIEPREWSEPEPATSFRTIDGEPIYWRNTRGVVHACEGADIHPDVRALWTLCGKDAPAGRSTTSRETQSPARFAKSSS